LAAAMSSSPPPAEVGTPPEGPAGVLTGYPLPPAPGPLTVLGAWRPAPFGMALACVLVLLWWRPTAPARTRAGTLRLLLGAATLVLLTSGPLNVYGKVLISAHALQHVLLVVPAGVLLGSVLLMPTALRGAITRRWWLAVPCAAAGPAVLIGIYLGPLLRPGPCRCWRWPPVCSARSRCAPCRPRPRAGGAQRPPLRRCCSGSARASPCCGRMPWWRPAGSAPPAAPGGRTPWPISTARERPCWPWWGSPLRRWWSPP